MIEERLFDTGALFDLYKGRQRARVYFDRLLDGSLAKHGLRSTGR